MRHLLIACCCFALSLAVATPLAAQETTGTIVGKVTDQTGAVLQKIADPRMVRIIPDRKDLGIGGCWNTALFSAACGRYAVQLDSDDLYAGNSVLARVVEELERGPHAMVVASYTLVDFELREIPPTDGVLRLTATATDRLDLLAHRFYRDPTKFWRICDASDHLDPTDVVATNAVVVIPPNK